MYNIVKDVRGVGEGDWEKLLSHLLREMWIEISARKRGDTVVRSHLLREMWIEIGNMVTGYVAIGGSHLLREMWIEIPALLSGVQSPESHLLREMWIEILKMNLIHHVQNESSPAGDVD